MAGSIEKMAKNKGARLNVSCSGPLILNSDGIGFSHSVRESVKKANDWYTKNSAIDNREQWARITEMRTLIDLYVEHNCFIFSK